MCLTVMMCYPLKLGTLAFLTQKRIKHDYTASLMDLYLLSCRPLSQDCLILKVGFSMKKILFRSKEIVHVDRICLMILVKIFTNIYNSN